MKFSPSKLKRLIEKRSLEEVARHAGVSRFTVSRWANGRGEPKVSQLARIAEASGHRVTYFLEAA